MGGCVWVSSVARGPAELCLHPGHSAAARASPSLCITGTAGAVGGGDLTMGGRSVQDGGPPGVTCDHTGRTAGEGESDHGGAVCAGRGPPWVSPVTTLGGRLGRGDLALGRGVQAGRGPVSPVTTPGGSRPVASGGIALWTAEPGILDLQPRRESAWTRAALEPKEGLSVP